MVSKIAHKRTSLSDRAELIGVSKNTLALRQARRSLRRFVDSALFNFVIAILILISVGLIFMEFLILPGEKLDRIVTTSDIITWIFVVELTLRFIAAPSKRVYFANYWIDILSVLPVLRIFRSLRLLRLLRLLRVTRAAVIILRQSGWLSLRFERYFGNFAALFFTAALLVICGTLALLTVEQTPLMHKEPSTAFLQKIWHTIFLFVSGEFVDELPQTEAGRAIAALISVSGLVVFAVMVGTITASMNNYFRTKMDEKDLTLDDLQNHLIICGWDRLGKILLSELESLEEFWSRGIVVVADTEINIAKDAHVRNARRLFHVRDDFTRFDVLEKVGATRARVAVVLADPGHGHTLGDQDRDARTVLAALTLEKLNPEIFTCAELLDEANAPHLRVAGVEEIISRASLAGGLLATTVVNHGVVGVLNDLLTHKEGATIRKISVPKEYIGQEYLQVFHQFKERYDVTLLGIESEDENGETIRAVNPPSHQRIKVKDKLVLMVNVNSDFRDLISE